MVYTSENRRCAHTVCLVFFLAGWEQARRRPARCTRPLLPTSSMPIPVLSLPIPALSLSTPVLSLSTPVLSLPTPVLSVASSLPFLPRPCIPTHWLTLIPCLLQTQPLSQFCSTSLQPLCLRRVCTVYGATRATSRSKTQTGAVWFPMTMKVPK